MKRIVHHSYRVMRYAVLLTLILVAIVSTVSRLLLNEVTLYHDKLEAFFSQQIGQPITIGALRADLLGLHPEVMFEDVTLWAADRSHPLAHFDGIAVELNTVSSLRRRSVILTSATVIGAELELVRRKSGLMQLEGMGGGATAETDGGELGQWLFQQGDLGFRESRVNWRDEISGRVLQFEKVDFLLRNRGRKHSVFANLALPKGLGKSFQFRGVVTGNPFVRKDWHADLYTRIDSVDLAAVGEYVAGDHPPVEGTATGEVWASWQEGQLVNLEGVVDADHLQIRRNRQRLALDTFKSRFRVRLEESGVVADFEGLQWRRGRQGGGPSRVHLAIGDGKGEVLADDFEIGILPQLLAFTGDSDGIKRILQAVPSGRVSEVHLQWGPDGIRGRGQFRDLFARPTATTPGFGGLDGSVRFDTDGGELHVDSRNAWLDMPNLFRAPLTGDRLAGDIDIRRAGRDWLVYGRRLRVDNADLALTADLDLEMNPDGQPLIDLRGNIERANARAVSSYLPAKIMSTGAIEWLDAAFVDGAVDKGSFIYHGVARGFPYRDVPNGRFVVDFTTRGVELAFNPEWPHLFQTNARVVFDGPGLNVEGQSTRLLSSMVKDVHVAIPDLKAARLSVALEHPIWGQDALAILTDTSLNRFGGGAASRMRLGGDVLLKLGLSIDIAGFHTSPRPVQVDGQVTFQGNRLQLVDGIVVDNLSGTFSFSPPTFSGDNLAGELFGHPLQISAFTSGEDAHPITTVAFHGDADANALEAELPWWPRGRVSGSSPFQGAVTIGHGAGEVGLAVSSDLIGLELALPAPLEKPAAEPAETRVELMLGGARKGELTVSYGDRLTAVVDLDSDDWHLRRGALRAGAGEVVLPPAGNFSVKGDKLVFDPKGWWALLPHQQGKSVLNGFTIDLAGLHLVEESPPTDGTTTPRSSAPRTQAQPQLPNASVNIGELIIGDNLLGKVEAHAVREGGGWRLGDFLIAHPAITFTGRGGVVDGDSPESSLELEVRSPDIGKAMTQLGFASVISKGKTQVVAKLRWPGQLVDADNATLGGWIDVKIEDGTIDELNMGAGRLLGLFSLQALPRRLFLDFSDLFRDGMTFRRIKGRFRIADGNAYTQDLHMESDAAKILVTGRTGLVARDFDKQIVVIPNVSDTVSIVGGLSLGPQVGAVLLLLQKLFESDIQEATMIEYSLHGTWKDPIIEKRGETLIRQPDTAGGD